MVTTPASDRPVVFLVALATLLVAHQLGDHVLQTDRQAGDKAGRGASAVRAMAGHLASYHVAAAALLLGTFTVLGLPLTWLGVGPDSRSRPSPTGCWTAAGRSGRCWCGRGRPASPSRPPRSAGCTRPTRRCTRRRC